MFGKAGNKRYVMNVELKPTNREDLIEKVILSPLPESMRKQWEEEGEWIQMMSGVTEDLLGCGALRADGSQ